ncbi:MAG: 3-(methylthio)propionyl---CoA ligase, partial [Paraburkholderia sp.]|nr:3-(methylthio)propionyl---CoA ligase [Paraburkholderia sp.]
MSADMYEAGLGKRAANFTVLTPLKFIERSAAVYPSRLAVVHGDVRRTWGETYARARRLASALSARGIGFGDTVAFMLPNIPPMVEAHFGVPMIGAVLNALNTRLDAATLAFMLNHGEAKAVFVDREFSTVMRTVLPAIERPILVVDVDDPMYRGPGERIGEIEYEALLASAEPAFGWQLPSDEWNAISLNYTSGTTGNPKGVVYHHRGAYTNAISNILEWDMPKHAVYLWTLPMFHCNGWCFPWTVAARAGVNVCLRKVEAKAVFDLIRSEHVTHYCGAPIVHNMLVNAPDEMKAGIDHRVSAMVAGAAPPAALIENLERLGFELTHVYGLTEVYGPAAVCPQQAEWSSLDVGERASLNARQGVSYHLQDAVTVLDPETMQPVPADGET